MRVSAVQSVVREISVPRMPLLTAGERTRGIDRDATRALSVQAVPKQVPHSLTLHAPGATKARTAHATQRVRLLNAHGRGRFVDIIA